MKGCSVCKRVVCECPVTAAVIPFPSKFREELFELVKKYKHMPELVMADDFRRAIAILEAK